jgi:L-asparaginase
MASVPSKVIILGTGGTIAGTAARAGDNVGYRAGQVAVAELVAAVPALAGTPLQAEQLAQLDSKDMSPALWSRLAARITALLAQADVAGVVVTHGTDTLEETAWCLHRAVVAHKPVVLTAAMRPATSLQADGPQNLLDAVLTARAPGACGVLAVLAGRMHAGAELRKLHNYRIDAFGSGDAGPLGLIEEGQIRQLRAWPRADLSGPLSLPQDASAWPWVEIVSSHAGADGRVVDLLVQAGVRGLVVAATGNGTIHADLRPALERARSLGVAVLRSTRCALGALVPDGGPIEGAGALTPAQARVELMLRLLSRG